MAGLQATGCDGEVVTSPVSGVYLRCEECGGLLRFLVRFRGRVLCKACIAFEATRRVRP